MKPNRNIFTKTGLRQVLLGCGAALLASTAYALPALQLGTVSGYDPALWTYNTVTETWDYTGGTGTTANVGAYANADAPDGTGAYAWDVDGAADQWAYLVVSTVPQLAAGTDYFDININNVSGATLVTSGWGAPPLEDSNSLAPHGIFDTYFEIYQFQFDGGIGTISNTQPPGVDTGLGYAEAFAVTINSLNAGVTGLHFDLFTTTGSGPYSAWAGDPDKFLVNANAPFSHDVQWNPGTGTGTTGQVPVPGTLFLLGLGLMGLGWSRRVRA